VTRAAAGGISAPFRTSFPMKALRLLLLAAATLLAACSTKPPSCDAHFLDGQAPQVTSPNLAKDTRMLCFSAYAVDFSGVSKTPLWSAEHLTAKEVEQAHGLQRKNAFHAEERLPASMRSELTDYARSGYDRGHMSPSGDMPTEDAQYESFSLANMIPQSPKNNQILWEGIEEAARSLARREGELYIVTGPLFEGDSLERINGRVLVPTAVFKAIYDPAAKAAAAYLTDNAPGMAYRTLSIAELEERAHINLFPKLPPEIKAAKMALPVPTPHGGRSNARPVEITANEGSR
jgi:endonuclease G